MIGALTLDQLRVLVAVADAGSFSAAARQVGRAQSAISQSIANLETRHGVTLFDRTAYRPLLTETGRGLVAQARAVLRSAARFEAVAEQARGGIEPELTLAIDPLVPSAPLKQALRDLNETFPDLAISFSTESLGGSLRRLRDGSATVAFCTLLPAVPEDVVAIPIARFRMLPVVSVSHPLAKLGRSATTEDLEPYVQLVLADPVAPEGPNFGLLGERQWRFADLNRRMDFLLDGFGWCRMPEHLVTNAIAEGSLVSLVLEHDTAPPEGLTIFAAHLRSSRPGPAAQRLLSIASPSI